MNLDVRGCLRIAVVLATLGTAVAAQSFLQLYGEPYFDGEMAFSVTDPVNVGAPVWIAYGLDPLPRSAPGPTQYGPLFIGDLKGLTFAGAIPATGRLDVSIQMPSVIPPAVGVPYAVQAFVANQLSNPATLPFDLPYLEPGSAISIPHPMPSPGASFGDQVAAGDLNDDGVVDIAVGAWFEDTAGVDRSGSVYVLWGPDFTAFTRLVPSDPKVLGEFGACVLIDEVTGDAVVDLIVGEASGYPAVPNGPGFLHVYSGGPALSTSPSQSIPSLDMGLQATLFGRNAITGDFNDDGIKDLAVPRPKAIVASMQDAGRVDVYWGPAFNAVMSVENPSPSAGDFFGTFVAVGDVNGDGTDDLVEGSARADVSGINNVGRVHIFVGPTLALAQTLEYPLTAVLQAGFGEDLVAVDLDGDGFDDIITADDLDNAFIFWAGNPADVTRIQKPPSKLANPFGETLFALSMTVSDTNQDGLRDVIISDPADGDLAGCSLASTGMVLAALAPYFQTFHRLPDPAGDCGDLHGVSTVAIQLDLDAPTELVVGSPAASAGKVIIRD